MGPRRVSPLCISAEAELLSHKGIGWFPTFTHVNIQKELLFPPREENNRRICSAPTVHYKKTVHISVHKKTTSRDSPRCGF